MKPNVYCLTTSTGVQNFYIEACGKTHYLFSQKFKRGVKDYFGNGVYLDAAIDFSRAKRNTAVVHTMRKLPLYIKYIEKENGIKIFNKTVRKNVNFKGECPNI